MTACVNCPGQNVEHQHAAEAGLAALRAAINVTRTNRSAEAPAPVDGGPVSDGPAPAHPNADTHRSPAPQVRFSHKF